MIAGVSISFNNSNRQSYSLEIALYTGVLIFVLKSPQISTGLLETLNCWI